MLRKIIQIDEDKCNGCGACASACQEGAIGIVNNKAKLIRDDYCDGLGNCLPACPTGAITFVEREAAAFDEKAVDTRNEVATSGEKPAIPYVASACTTHTGGCPGSQARAFTQAQSATDAPPAASAAQLSRLAQWPVQIKLAPVRAPYYQNARLMVAADCAAYAYGNFHEQFMKNHVTLIGCPKLDGVDYAEKLTAILQSNDIRSVTVVRMKVPCCGGLERAVTMALQSSGKKIPWQVVTLTTDGRIEE
jgi:ferredoxin